MPLTPHRVEARRSARARELTLHAAILACAVWAAVGADVISPGPLGRFSGFQKGNDFVQFYVAGSLAGDGAFGDLVDPDRFRQAQAAFLQGQGAVSFPPVYGPQVALFFSPLARLRYLAAYGIWTTLTLSLTFWSVSACRRRCPSLGRCRWPVAVAAAAYPPLGYLVLDGQLSAIALAALTLAIVAFGRGSRVAAGAALGLLGYKVSLFAPALAVCVAAGEWRVAGVAGITAVLQLAATLPIVGPDVVLDFLENTGSFARAPDALARNPYLMASFRTFWAAVLPAPVAMPAYVVSAASSLAIAGWGWRRTSNPLCRIGLLALAVTLASPHLFMYDLVILAPAFIASAGILVTERALALRWCTWLAFVAPLAAPLAAVTHVQLVTLVHVTWLVALAIRPKNGPLVV